MVIVLPNPPKGFNAPELKGKVEFETIDKIEIAGQAFFENFEKDTFVEIIEEVVEDDDSSVSSGSRTPGSSTPGHSKKSKVRSGMLKLDDNLKGIDIYEFLGIPSEYDDKMLKKAFQKASLKYHPDKTTKDLGEEKANAQYVSLQEAYEILRDPVKRRKYDSAQPFDDAVPREKDLETVLELREAGETADAEKEFYDLFYGVFKRNAKWSCTQPVPEFPKEDDLAEAQKFYKFWFNFDSWRDFDLIILEEEGEDALSDPTKADSRDERRFNENKNVAIRQRYRNKESARIMKLVELAEKYDARIIRANNEKWEKKNAGKLKKQREAEEKASQEKEAAEQAIKDKEEAEKKKATDKLAKEGAKQILKNTRRDIRNISKIALAVNQEQMQDMLTEKMPGIEELTAFLEELHPKSSDKNAVTELIFAKMTSFGMDPIKLDEAKVMAERKAAEELEAQKAAEQAEAEAAAEAKKNNKKGKKNNKKKKGKGGASPDDDEDEPDSAQLQAEAYENTHAREADKAKNSAKKAKEVEKKKAQEAAKAEKEMKDAEKKTAQKAKEEEEKKAKAEATKKKAEDDKKKKADEAAAKKKAQKLAIVSEDFCMLRKRQFEHVDEECGSDIKGWLSNNLSAGVKCAIHALAKKGNDSTDDEALKIDMACAIVSAADSEMSWIEVGRTAGDKQNELDLSDIKNKTKKLRQRIRDALKSFIDAQAKGDVPADLQKIIGEFPDLPSETWEAELEKKAAAATAESGDGEGKKKKKKKAPKANDDDDFEAALAEFGVEAPSKKKKNKK